MSRKEYMKELAYLLQDIPEGEREEALAWYEDYFDDAGPGQEAEVIKKLGSPEKVAAVIKDGLGGRNEEAGEYTEAGYRDDRFREDNKVPEPRMEPLREEKDTGYHYDKEGVESKRKRSRGEILLILMLCIIAIPVILPIAGGVFGVLAGLFGAGLAVAVAVPVCVVVAVILGIIFIGVGIAEVFLSPGFGLLMMGGGFLALAAGILLSLVCVLVIGRLIPWAFRGITGFIGRIFKRGGYAS